MDEYLLCLRCGMFCDIASLVCPACGSELLISEEEYIDTLRDSQYSKGEVWVDDESEDNDNA